jgi:cellulose synthase (UDP-forming)
MARLAGSSRACVISSAWPEPWPGHGELLCILLTWRYIWWRWTETLPPFELRFDSLFAWCFSAVEALAVIGWTISFITLSRTNDRSGEASQQIAWLERLPNCPRVDLLIATYNEEEAILTRTIIGALGIDFPDMRVWVLDDGRRSWLRDLCESKGAHYLTRPDNKGAKAGNINHALGHLRRLPDPPEFVAILDADFVPHQQFLRRTMPLFHDGCVGVVQTPQHFFNRDPIQSNLLVGHVWPDEQRFFFDHALASKDAWGAAFCCGTSSVIRLEALNACGGHFPTESVTEDFLLSLEMDRFGWRTVYLNEPLSAGLAPEGINQYLMQRGRWCLGLMQILRSPWGPLSRQRLSLAYRIGLIDAFLYWAASYLFKLLCLVTPIVYWFTGVTVGQAPASEVVSHFLPYYAAVMVTLYWATGGLIQPVLTDVSHVLTMPAALRATIAGLLKPRGHKFKVTAKGGRRERVVVQWGMIARFGLLAGLTVAGMLYGSLADYAPERQEAGSTAIVLLWSIYNIVVLLLAMVACVELPRYRNEERFATSEQVRVWTADGALIAPLIDISRSGATVLAPPPGGAGDTVMLRINEVGEIAGRIVRTAADRFAVAFVDPDEACDALTRKLYSGRYYEHLREVQGRRLFRVVVARAFR